MFDYLNLLKYFSLLVCSYYSYIKLSRIKSDKKRAFIIPVLIVGAFAIYGTSLIFKPVMPFALLAASMLICKLVFKKPVYETVTLSIIACGIAVVIYSATLIVNIPVLMPLFFIKDQSLKTAIGEILIYCLMLPADILLFKVRRLKSGIEPKSKNGLFILMLISSIVSLLVLALFYTDKAQEQKTLHVSFAVYCASSIFGWWKKFLSDFYLKRVHKRDLETFEKQIGGLQKENVSVTTQNHSLSAVVHSDNKYNSAMTFAVESVIKSGDKKQAKELLKVLKSSAAKRKNALKEYEARFDGPKTGDVIIDALAWFLGKKAGEYKVKFNFRCEGKFYDGAKEVDRADFNTLLCDIGENAVIAAGDVKNGEVFVCLKFKKGVSVAEVYDNGKFFDKKVIAALGKRKYTTRKDKGGSGIGLSTAFDICRKYRASFTLDESLNDGVYTKVIRVEFDGKYKRVIVLPLFTEEVAATEQLNKNRETEK